MQRAYRHLTIITNITLVSVVSDITMLISTTKQTSLWLPAVFVQRRVDSELRPPAGKLIMITTQILALVLAILKVLRG